jgi:hypothetical protein
MAIKTSGQLSLRYDIAAEISGLTSEISLRKQADAAGFSSPDAMSEFYGYSATVNNYYREGKGTWYANTSASPVGMVPANSEQSLNGWFNPRSALKRNLNLFSTGSTNRGLPRATFKVHYIANLNRMSLAVYDYSGIRRLRREYPLHDNPNSAITGVTDYRVGWMRDQPGNQPLNGKGMCMITATWDGNQSYTGLKLYWNGQELTYSVNNNSTTIASLFSDHSYLAHGNTHYDGVNASIFQGRFDSFGIFMEELTAAEVLAIANDGNKMLESGPGSYWHGQGYENDLTTQQYNSFPNMPTMAMQGSTGTFEPHT